MYVCMYLLSGEAHLTIITIKVYNIYTKKSINRIALSKHHLIEITKQKKVRRQIAPQVNPSLR